MGNLSKVGARGGPGRSEGGGGGWRGGKGPTYSDANHAVLVLRRVAKPHGGLGGRIVEHGFLDRPHGRASEDPWEDAHCAVRGDVLGELLTLSPERGDALPALVSRIGG